MDLTLSAEQEMLVDAARRFLARAWSLADTRATERDPRGFRPEVWRAMAGLGWQGMELPAALGGGGLGFVETILVLEEMGRVLLPSPFLPTVVLCAPLIQAVGSEAQRRWLAPSAAGAVAALAYMAGAAERALEMTVDHARTRVQFGRPIGSFQAVAHRCVDMRTDLDALRHLVYQAAWALGAGREAPLAVSAALAYGSEALRRLFMHAHQVHGAIGFSTEHDLHLFTRRAKAAELQWGSSARHHERVAQAMGL